MLTLRSWVHKIGGFDSWSTASLKGFFSTPGTGKTSSHFLKPLFAFLKVRTKSGLSHMMMVHTQATPLKPLLPLLHLDCRKGAQYILGNARTFPLFRPSPAF
jgi:hypothetical protein